MRVLVRPHDMNVGGSQINAIELAGEVARRGHEVLVAGEDGPLVELVAHQGLEFLPLAGVGRRPSPVAARQLNALVRERRVDVVHGYEWPPALEAVLGPHLLSGAAVTATVMSMGVAPFLPRRMPLVVGTSLIAADCRANGFLDVTLLEPPVDTVANARSAVPPAALAAARAQWGLTPDDVVVVVVSRLAVDLKREGLLAAVQAAGALAADPLPAGRLRLLIVGDGPVRGELEELARRVNTQCHREVVTLAGEVRDPRPAYALADIALGMGSSALRAMAFASPLVVQGERGFWNVLDDSSAGDFLEQGWYGIGAGDDGVARLVSMLRELLAAPPERRRQLGDLGRRLVCERFSLTRAGAVQEQVYERVAVTASRRRLVRDLPRSGSGLLAYKVQRKIQRVRGTVRTDDFNATAAQPRGLSRVTG